MSGRLYGIALLPAMLIVSAVLREAAMQPPPPVPLTPAAPSVVSTSAAQDLPLVVISGTVVDAVTSKPLEGAEIAVPELGAKVRSDAGGKFALPPIPVRPRGYEVLVTSGGYTSATQVVTPKPEQRAFDAGAIKLKPRGW